MVLVATSLVMVATSLVMVATSLVMVVTSLVMVATSIIVITTIMTIMSLPRSAAAHHAAGSGYFLTGRVAFDYQIVIIIIQASQGEFSKISLALLEAELAPFKDWEEIGDI